MDECKSNVIYELEVGKRSREQLHEDTPEAYRVVKAKTASGIIVFGRYPGGRWIANPSCRELIAHLLRSGGHLTPQSSGPETSPDSCISENVLPCKNPGNCLHHTEEV